MSYSKEKITKIENAKLKAQLEEALQLIRETLDEMFFEDYPKLEDFLSRVYRAQASQQEALAAQTGAHGDEAVRKDAERYRWLKDWLDDSPQSIYMLPSNEGDLMDEAIDAAMRAEGDEKS